MKISIGVKYLIVIAIYVVIFLFIDKMIIDDNLYRISFQNKLSDNQIALVLGEKHKYSWLAYFLSIVIITIKLVFVTLVIFSCTILTGYKIPLSQIFKCVLYSEFILIVPFIVKIIYFTFAQTDYTLEDVQYFAPLSLLNFFDPTSIDPIWVYPLQAVNIFEIIYWFALAYGIWRLSKTSFESSFFLVMKSYLPALVLWIAFIMFLTVTLSPA